MSSHPTRWASVIAVMVAAPWFAEFSWGGYPLWYLPVALLFVGPLYGCSAADPRRRGAHRLRVADDPSAGRCLRRPAGRLVDQSLFNPVYARYDVQHPAHVDGIDISLYYLVAFVSGHVVASIAAPLVIVGTWSRRPAEPWLGRLGLWLIGVLNLVSTVVNHVGVKDEEGDGFQSAPLQVGVAAATVALLIGAALAAGIVFIAVVTAAVGTWSRSIRWTGTHTFALAMGSVLVGAVSPLLVDPYDDSVSRAPQLTAATAAALVCATIVIATTWRHIRSRSSLGISKSTSPAS